MIHVCFGLHDATGRYAKFTGTAMLSLFDNTNSDVTVHILHDNTLTPDNRDKFAYIAGRYGQRVKFYNVETLCADKIAEMVSLVPAVKNSHVSVGAFYRLLISQILPFDIEKIIYLDSDIAINRDINELWQVNLNGKILAAVSEGICGTDTNTLFLCTSGLIKHEEYFNSGVMLVDLKQLRKEETTIMDNGINLSNTVIKTYRVDISAISQKEPVLPYWMNILTYLVENFFIIKMQVPTVVLYDLNSILEIYLVAILQIFRFR